MTPFKPKYNAELVEVLAKEAEIMDESLRRMVRVLAEVVGVDVEALTLLRSMETFAEERGIKLC